ncbi:glycosyl hydrolases family 18-domain-containing protein [Lanmaoa asiatica]|nr:glycosyl hydrolases family 18-domain-containing protein [Lanmaoa asiatica]
MSTPTTSTSSSSLAGPSGQSPHPMLENNEEKNSVVIKVGMVGDSQIGKTSLMVKYVEGSFDEDYIQTLGVNFMEKTITVRRTTITFSIWDLGGQREFVNMLPLVCNDAVAILFMFDLSRKSTLNSVKEWYRQARGFNKTAIPFLIGTKFDTFATFPRDEQEEITKQAKRFARAMHASLIFCSTSASINVQKIFKIVLAKAFDLKCVIPEIEGVGEPHATPGFHFIHPSGIFHELVSSFHGLWYLTNLPLIQRGIYAANFQPTDIDPSQLTHILYAFADISPDTGKAFLTDSWADEEKHFPGDSWDDQGNNLYGCLKQVMAIPIVILHLKVLLSVGGWTYSQDGHFSFLTDSDLRGNFVASAVQLIKDYGFDGLDIDFEYPANEVEGQGFLDLMTSLRDAFDDLAIANGDTTPYELTAAVSAGSQNNAYYPVPLLDRVLTHWNLMVRRTFSLHYLSQADNQANLYGDSRTDVSTDAAVKHYISSGATPRKIAMGIPLYGRAFENTNGIGQPYSGVGPGTFAVGVYSYKYLPLPGAQVFEDLVDVASYSYDPVKRELVSYDIPDIVRIKAEYVTAKSLAGCMFWELSTDKTGSDSLVHTAGVTLGQLDQTPVSLSKHYPHSKWDNIRDNMGSESTTAPSQRSTSTSHRPTTSTYTPTPPTPTTPPNSCLCADVSPWNRMAVYTGGDEAVYDGHLWTAKWWTENDVPGGAGKLLPPIVVVTSV